MTTQNSSERDPKRWLALIAAIVAMLAAVFDGALMGLISPSVAQDLGADSATMGLISSLSMLMLAAFIMGGGTLGDIYGRKRFLMIGLIGISVTSLLAMLAPTSGILIPARALSGIMAALINPLALAVIMVSFDADERPKALGIYGAAIGAVGGLGTIVIASLNQSLGWRSAFGLIIILALVGLVLVSLFVKESKAGGNKRIDWIGILLTAAGLFLIVFGINQAAVEGFGSTKVLIPVGIGIILLVVLVLYSRKAKDPALKLSLFKNKIFWFGCLIFLLMGFAATGSFFQLSTFLQSLQEVSPIQASITLLPYTLAMFIFSILAGGWTRKFSKQILISGGLVSIFVGLVIMALTLSPDSSGLAFLLPLVLIGGGFSLANVPRMSAVLGSAPTELAGSASATNNACSQLGSSLGIAIMGALFQLFARNTYFKDLTTLGLSAEEINKSVEVLTTWLKDSAGDVVSQFGITVQQLEGVIQNYQNAYTTGVTSVLWIGAVIILIGAIGSWFIFSSKAKQG